jgi:hypothetical protein
MSFKNVRPVAAIALFFGAILLFSQSGNPFSNSHATHNALCSSVESQTLVVEGTVPPPVSKPIKPASLS